MVLSGWQKSQVTFCWQSWWRMSNFSISVLWWWGERTEGERRGEDAIRMQNTFFNFENGQGKWGVDKCENLEHINN